VNNKLNPIGVAYFESDGIYIESNTDTTGLKYFKWWISQNIEVNIIDAVERFVEDVCPKEVEYSSETMHPCGERPILYFYDTDCFKRFAVFMSLLMIGVPKNNAINIIKNMDLSDINMFVNIINSIVVKYEDVDEHKEEIEGELRSKILQHIY